jgi:hypothetical protein
MAESDARLLIGTMSVSSLPSSKEEQQLLFDGEPDGHSAARLPAAAAPTEAAVPGGSVASEGLASTAPTEVAATGERATGDGASAE